jgi:hypothetical protein
MKERYNMNLIIELKTVYGNDLIYPVCDKAKKLCQITNQKTFSQFAIQKLKEIGFTFTQKEVSL